MLQNEFSPPLASWIFGPIELSNSQKSSICEQYIKHHITDQEFHTYLNRYDSDRSSLNTVYSKDINETIEAFAKTNNLSRAESIKTMMENFFDCEVGSIFYETISSGELQYNQSCTAQAVNFTRSIAFPALNNMTLGSDVYELFFKVNYASIQGNYYLAELIYFNQTKKQYFTILARASGFYSNHGKNTINTLVLGHKLSKFGLMNENKMIKSSNLPIVLCHDKFTTNVLQETLDAIITTFPGSRIEKVDTKHLEHRDVIIIPLVSKLSYKLALEQAIAINETANSVRISTTPYIISEHFNHPTDTIDDKFIDYVIKNIKLTKEFNMSDLQKNSKTILEYEKFLVDYGIMPPQKTKFQKTPLSTSLIDTPRDATKFELKKILSPHYISACYGQQNSGKTLFCYSLALSFALGFNIFGFVSTEKANILYIDGENSLEKAAAKIFQIANSHGYTNDEVDKYINVLSRKNTIFGSLLDSNTQDIIKSRIMITKAKLVVFDNLLDLAPEVNRSPTKWNDLSQWFKTLSNDFGISILYVHHLSDKGENIGAQEVRFLTHNYFHIYPSKNKKGNDKDCHIELWMQKNKEYTKLNGHLGDFLLLESDSSTPPEQWKMTTPGEVYEINKIYGQQTSNYVFDTELSDRENEILNFIVQRGWVSNEDVVKHISFGTITFLKQNRKYTSETIRKELFYLVKKGLLQHDGNKTRRKYCIPSDSITD